MSGSEYSRTTGSSDDSFASPSSRKSGLDFNINESVEVILNKSGVEIMRRRHNEFGERFTAGYPFVEPSTVDPTKFQLWQLMQIFGPHLSLGRAPPFETTIRLLGVGDAKLSSTTGPSGATSESNAS